MIPIVVNFCVANCGHINRFEGNIFHLHPPTAKIEKLAEVVGGWGLSFPSICF